MANAENQHHDIPTLHEIHLVDQTRVYNGPRPETTPLQEGMGTLGQAALTPNVGLEVDAQSLYIQAIDVNIASVEIAGSEANCAVPTEPILVSGNEASSSSNRPISSWPIDTQHTSDSSRDVRRPVNDNVDIPNNVRDDLARDGLVFIGVGNAVKCSSCGFKSEINDQKHHTDSCRRNQSAASRRPSARDYGCHSERQPTEGAHQSTEVRPTCSGASNRTISPQPTAGSSPEADLPGPNVLTAEDLPPPISGTGIDPLIADIYSEIGDPSPVDDLALVATTLAEIRATPLVAISGTREPPEVNSLELGPTPPHADTSTLTLPSLSSVELGPNPAANAPLNEASSSRMATLPLLTDSLVDVEAPATVTSLSAGLQAPPQNGNSIEDPQPLSRPSCLETATSRASDGTELLHQIGKASNMRAEIDPLQQTNHAEIARTTEARGRNSAPQNLFTSAGKPLTSPGASRVPQHMALYPEPNELGTEVKSTTVVHSTSGNQVATPADDGIVQPPNVEDLDVGSSIPGSIGQAADPGTFPSYGAEAFITAPSYRSGTRHTGSREDSGFESSTQGASAHPKHGTDARYLKMGFTSNQIEAVKKLLGCSSLDVLDADDVVEFLCNVKVECESKERRVPYHRNNCSWCHEGAAEAHVLPCGHVVCDNCASHNDGVCKVSVCKKLIKGFAPFGNSNSK